MGGSFGLVGRLGSMLLDGAQELRELGPKGTLFRVGCELGRRSGLHAAMDTVGRWWGGGSGSAHAWGLHRRLRFGSPEGVAEAMAGRTSADAVSALVASAEAAAQGTVLCFGRWTAELGVPMDWHRDPVSGVHWDPHVHASLALSRRPPETDVKLTWEAARFPHAYHIARAGAYARGPQESLARALLAQMESFAAANPRGTGIHWCSSQEVAFRMMAWLFAQEALLNGTRAGLVARSLVAESLGEAAVHIQSGIRYAQLAVYNNHLLSEALGLYLAGCLLNDHPDVAVWRRKGRSILDEQAERQFYRDGAYIQQSHNYHRLALQDLLWACVVARSAGEPPGESWLRAMERSLDFLIAQQNPKDGRLPNYGANDGALPSILSTCDFADFRPILQAVSLATRGERVYEPGPWDEEAAWFLGPEALDAPLRPPHRRSVSFAGTGYHLLRGAEPDSFALFRCGSVRDRFSQIDMLHLDLWWRGENVLVDGGSYLYNGPPSWHNHFVRTASHNTLTVDDRDQMLHHRQFKCLYWTRARLLRFVDAPTHVVCGGEHDGYARHPGRCIHRRFALFVKDDLWVVVDRVEGEGRHAVRLHWLGGDFDHADRPGQAWMALRTPAGPFHVQVLDVNGAPAPGNVVRGREAPPRGWLSRYYGEKVAVPSLAVRLDAELPLTLVSVLCGGEPEVTVRDSSWTVEMKGVRARFRLLAGQILDAAAERTGGA